MFSVIFCRIYLLKQLHLKKSLQTLLSSISKHLITSLPCKELQASLQDLHKEQDLDKKLHTSIETSTLAISESKLFKKLLFLLRFEKFSVSPALLGLP